MMNMRKTVYSIFLKSPKNRRLSLLFLFTVLLISLFLLVLPPTALQAQADTGVNKSSFPKVPTGIWPPSSNGEEFQYEGYVRKLTKIYDQLLTGENASGQIIDILSRMENQDEIHAHLEALGYSVENKKKYDTAAQVFDQLTQKKDLQSTLLAADVLLKIIMATKISGYGITREIVNFPDIICDRAATLLDHSNPVVQSMGEWTLALRVKKQNFLARNIKDVIRPESCKKAWYLKWLKRTAQYDLQDDYGRQLVHLNRHRTLQGLNAEVDKVTARIDKMLAAPNSQKTEALYATFMESAKNTRAAITKGDLDAGHKAYIELRKAGRKVVEAGRSEFPVEGLVYFTNNAIPGGIWNVNVPVTGDTNIPFGDIYIKKSADPAAPVKALIPKKKIGDGSVRGIDLSWEGDKILFSYWLQPIDGTKPFGWNHTKNAHLFEMDLKTGDVKQLTNTPGYNDIEPCFLPDGGYVFASDRSSFGNQCAGPFLQDKRCTTLYRLDPRRSDKPVAISNNKDFDRHPHVLNDGTVSFMHWEYQERDLYHLHTVWRCRPDGTNMDAYYKQHINLPCSIRDVQQAPDSDFCAATAQGHHDAQDGPVILFNPSLGINNEKAMWLVTPGVTPVERGLGPLYKQVVPEGGVENRGGSYINPFPMSDKAFLVGHEMNIGDRNNEPEFVLYYIDVWGNKELLQKDDEMSAFMPYPLRPRKRPPVVADTVDPKKTYATAFVENVYRDLPGVKKGAVKYLRMSQSLMLPAPVDNDSPQYDFNHIHWLPGDATMAHFGYWDFSPKRTVGIVKVEADGSAYFKVPAGTPVYLQALDENYCEIRRMRTSFTLQRGEFRGCTGCHESRLQAVGTKPVYPKETLEKGPQMPVEPTWGINTVMDYRKHIQPIFDKHCISCHGAEKPNAGLDLTGREIGGFSQSYRSIFGMKPQDPTIIHELDWHLRLHPEAQNDKFISGKEGQKIIKEKMQKNTWPGMLVSISDRFDNADITQPYQFGSNKSKLIRTLLDDEKHSKKVRPNLSEEEWLLLVTWVDHNANYYSTIIDKSEWNSRKKLTRVPYYLPSPWIPADTNPSFYNKTDPSAVPVIPEK